MSYRRRHRGKHRRRCKSRCKIKYKKKYVRALSYITIEGIDTDWKEQEIEFMGTKIGLYVDELLIIEKIVIKKRIIDAKHEMSLIVH